MSTLNPTQKKLLGELVDVRHSARLGIKVERMERNTIAELAHTRDMARTLGNAEIERIAAERLQAARERLIECRFHLIETGRRFMQLSREVSEHLPRAAWLEALSVNRSEWDTALMRQHGDDPGKVVCVLGLENSATRDDGIEMRPLNWCYTMALMNATRTSETLDRALHEATNEFFGGAFGEYRERSPLERMGIPAHMIPGGDE